MFVSLLTRINVPIFFMISGTLLLGKDETIKDLFKKRIIKIILAIIIFSVILYVKFNIKSNSINIQTLIEQILSGKVEASYWYLYSYLSALVMLPFLRAMVKEMKDKDYKYMLFFHFLIWSLLPMLFCILKNITSCSLSLSEYFNLPLISEKCIFYMLLGYYIDQKIEIKNIKLKHIFSMIGISIVCILISSAFTYFDGVNKKELNQQFFQLFDYVLAITVFITVKYIFVVHNPNDKLKNIIVKIGELTFGMYLLEPIIHSNINNFLNKLPFYLDSSSIFSSFFYCIMAMIVTGFITLILKEIPFVKKLL